ncbi:sulfurtransferase [Nocardioides sp. Bht2]|uniref:sulfurtransferase n=1 Tax=Nocardioides sp. Bht2 TaxID=3392297 RepID=UPI0039B3883F
MGISPLISVAELARSGETPVLLDVRWRLGGAPGAEEFARGHIPGAQYVDLDTALADPPGAGGRHPLPEPARFIAAMRAAGVDRGRGVVVYDDWSGHAAARAWWLLRHYGHDAVRLLDGGWSAWRDAGGEVAVGAHDPAAPGDFHGEPGAMETLTATEVVELAAAGPLLDARAPERYRGEVEPVDPVAGHIPGARNAPTGANLGTDGRFLGPEALRDVYAAHGVAPGVPVGVYCGSGVTAAHDVLALATIGVRAALYPGSWSEWVTDPTRPVATG